MLPNTDFPDDSIIVIYPDHHIDITPSEEAPTSEDMISDVGSDYTELELYGCDPQQVQAYYNELGDEDGLEENTIAPDIIEALTGEEFQQRLYGNVVVLKGKACWS